MRQSHDVTITGTAEPRKVRAEIQKDGAILARSPWIVLAAGERRTVQVTLVAEPGIYDAVQATNVGSNIHEDLVKVDLGRVVHGAAS